MRDLGNKKIVIYSAANPHGYFTSIIHRLLYNHDSYAVYIGDEGTATRAGGLELFDSHILYTQIAGQWGKMNHLSAGEYKDYLVKYFDEKIRELNIDIGAVSEIYAGSYWSDFPIYLNIKGIHHYLFQEGSQGLGFPSGEYTKKNFPSQYEVQEAYGIYLGLDNTNILAAYIGESNMLPEHPKKFLFDIAKAMTELSDLDKKTLIETFNMPSKIDESENSVLLLSQWFLKNKKVWADIETIRMYGLLADLYSNRQHKNTRIYLKSHPSDQNRQKYDTHLNNITVFNSQFPSEFLAIVPGAHFKTALTISSTSINDTAKYCDESYSIKNFDRFYNHILQIYVAFYLINKLNYNSYHFGVFNEVVIPLLKQNQSVLPKTSRWFELQTAIMPKDGAAVYNDFLWRANQEYISLSTLARQPYNSVIFIITDNIHNFIQQQEDLNYVNALSNIKIRVRPLADNITFEDDEKNIYIFCRNPDIKQKILTINYVDMLQVSGILCEKCNPTMKDEVDLNNNIYLNFSMNNSAGGVNML